MQAPPPPKSALGIYRLLSPSAGVRVSPLCLGAMSFGTAWKGLINSILATLVHHVWSTLTIIRRVQ